LGCKAKENKRSAYIIVAPYKQTLPDKMGVLFHDCMERVWATLLRGAVVFFPYSEYLLVATCRACRQKNFLFQQNPPVHNQFAG